LEILFLPLDLLTICFEERDLSEIVVGFLFGMDAPFDITKRTANSKRIVAKLHILKNIGVTKMWY
jgi:hypothetical protein